MGLSSGDMLIAGLTLEQFQKLEESLKELSEAEQSPLACALLLAKTLEEPGAKCYPLREIAGVYAQTGQSELALTLLSQALEGAKAFEHAFAQSNAMTNIAAVYAGIGHAGQASQILSEALDAARMIEDASTRQSALAAIAKQSADAGDFDQALKVLQIIQDGERSKHADNITSVMKDLAVKAAKAGEMELAANLLSQLLTMIQEVHECWRIAPSAGCGQGNQGTGF